MARIRSIHPGIHTDEAIVSVPFAARWLFVGLLNECDDQGAFEWKPVTLKMRILPADNVDVSELLGLLAEAGIVMRYSVAGRQYGAVRHFREFQRPKKPNKVFPMPKEFHLFAGTKAESSRSVPDPDGSGSAPVTHQSPTSGENSPQMEEEDVWGEEGVLEESQLATSDSVLAREGQDSAVEEKAEPHRPDSPAVRLSDPEWRFGEITGQMGTDGVSARRFATAGPFGSRRCVTFKPICVKVIDAAKMNASQPWDWDVVARWINDGLDAHNVILPAIRECASRPKYRQPGTLRYFDGPVRDYARLHGSGQAA